MDMPQIEHWMESGKYTCSIPEFAKLYGIKTDRARELCKSANPPPGFYSGSRYHILLSELESYMLKLSHRKRTVNAQ